MLLSLSSVKVVVAARVSNAFRLVRANHRLPGRNDGLAATNDGLLGAYYRAKQIFSASRRHPAAPIYPSMPRYPNAVRPSAMPRRQGSTESLAQCFKISPVRPFIVCYIYNVYPHFEDQSDLCSSWRCWSNMRGA